MDISLATEVVYGTLIFSAFAVLLTVALAAVDFLVVALDEAAAVLTAAAAVAVVRAERLGGMGDG